LTSFSSPDLKEIFRDLPAKAPLHFAALSQALTGNFPAWALCSSFTALLLLRERFFDACFQHL
ncbi:MAG: hypothetical protein K2O14_06415, partial [Oscillospiraceae bacterium]|nr:hypothetical protein [Oscillospiraceae bacterium]